MRSTEREPKPKICLFALTDIPAINSGDNVARIIDGVLGKQHLKLKNKDVLVVAQKIISKAEGNILALDSINPSQQAIEIARMCGKDERLVQIILNESIEILEIKEGTTDNPGFIVTRHRLGHVCTNAGIDRSNVGYEDFNHVTLLPSDPDKSAMEIARHFLEERGLKIGVLIIDSMGDPYRMGAIGKTLGIANIPARIYEPLTHDINGKIAKSDVAFADGIASFSMVLMGQGGEGTPVVIIRDLEYSFSPNSTTKEFLIRGSIS